MLIGLIAPESPRWLIKMTRHDEAEVIAKMIEPEVDTAARIESIEAALRREVASISWGEIFHREWRRPLLIAVWLAIFQQITGINAIIYYANQIFEAAGFTTEASRASVTLWAIGGVNVLATLIAIAFIDHVGRRKLLLWGLVGMGVSLVVVGVAFEFIETALRSGAVAGPTTAGVVTVAALILFITCFAFSLGPVTWTVINEVFPARIPQSRRGACDRRQLGLGLSRQPVLPEPGRYHRQLMDLLAVCFLLRCRLDLDLPGGA